MDPTLGTDPNSRATAPTNDAAQPEPTNVIIPARITTEPGSKITHHVNEFVRICGIDSISDLTFEEAVNHFKHGLRLQEAINRDNAFAGHAHPEEVAVENLTDLGIDQITRLERYEKLAIAVLPDMDAALDDFAKEVTAQVLVRPADDVLYLREAGIIAENIAAEFFTNARGNFDLPIADFTPIELEARMAELAQVAVDWLKAELEFQLHLHAAVGTPEQSLEEVLSRANFSSSSAHAQARGDKLKSVEALDQAQDEVLTAKLSPTLSALARYLITDKARVATEIPQPWRDAVQKFATIY